jgi:Lon protease-like protein
MAGPDFNFSPSPPEELAVFPLAGALLLPRGRLPLNIFEPRYLHMIDDALGNGRMIGMIQPAESQPHIVQGDCRLFDIGCVGRIVQFAETGDGRFLITLVGQARFRVAEEIDGRNGYRRVRADYKAFANDLKTGKAEIADRPRLIKAVRTFFSARGIDGDFDGIDQASDEMLVNSLSMASPFAPEEKQALLESADLQDRAGLLTALFEMALSESGGPGPGESGPRPRH